MTWRNMTPWNRGLTPGRTAPVTPPLNTPLIWAGGGALLMLSTWLVGVIALIRGIARLFG